MRKKCIECHREQDEDDFPPYPGRQSERSKRCRKCSSLIKTVRCCKRCGKRKPLRVFARLRPGVFRTICVVCKNEEDARVRAARGRKQCSECERFLLLSEFGYVGKNRSRACKSCMSSMPDVTLSDAELSQRVADFYAAKAVERSTLKLDVAISSRTGDDGKTEWVVRLPGGATLCRAKSYGEALAASEKWLEVRA